MGKLQADSIVRLLDQQQPTEEVKIAHSALASNAAICSLSKPIPIQVIRSVYTRRANALHGKPHLVQGLDELILSLVSTVEDTLVICNIVTTEKYLLLFIDQSYTQLIGILVSKATDAMLKRASDTQWVLSDPA